MFVDVKKEKLVLVSLYNIAAFFWSIGS